MSQQPSKNDRSLYRLKFPIAARPKIKIQENEFPVTELSEKGIRILPTDKKLLSIDQSFEAQVIYQSGEQDEVAGHVLRWDGDELILLLADGITMKRMMQLQLELK
ncbi:MAG: hypothetical protein AAGA30_17755, partial [Planctomycetota bacterium]